MRAYLERCGVEFDVAVNVLFGGQLGQTCSLRAELARKSGRRWGCIACRILSWLIQRDHCADQLTDVPAPASVYVRAGLAFGVAGLAAGSILHALAELVRSIL